MVSWDLGAGGGGGGRVLVLFGFYCFAFWFCHLVFWVVFWGFGFFESIYLQGQFLHISVIFK